MPKGKYTALFYIHLQCGHVVGRRFPCLDLASIWCPGCQHESKITGFTRVKGLSERDRKIQEFNTGQQISSEKWKN